ncbi:MAG: 3-hydroxybutyryl-CoA dehydrogenase [Betaproteobacteria bacterium]|nr:3-hydroxybutyryl-CoA dehydrogenase [Betaproteobacteria bacterium]
MSAVRFVAVGAGRMGRSIATAFAYAGHRVAVVDLRPRTTAQWLALQQEALAEVRASLTSLAELGAFPVAQVQSIVARVSWVNAPQADQALAQADMVFEGVPETMAAKQSALARIGAACRADAIITSTTSSILVTDLVPFVPHPERFLNIHWLNPAYLIPVVELSTHPRLEPSVLARAKDLMSAIGKLPVVCGPTPGYIVPRLQALVMNEAARMVQEGAATAHEIDMATRYGMGLRFAALGVIEFIDVGGNDILFHASREMAATIDPHRYATPGIVADKMSKGQLGLKTGAGFYDYDGRDIAAYRRDILSRTLGMLQHAGHWHPPATTTHD